MKFVHNAHSAVEQHTRPYYSNANYYEQIFMVYYIRKVKLLNEFFFINTTTTTTTTTMTSFL